MGPWIPASAGKTELFVQSRHKPVSSAKAEVHEPDNICEISYWEVH